MDEDEKHLKKVGLRNSILQCENGLIALRHYKKILEDKLEALKK